MVERSKEKMLKSEVGVLAYPRIKIEKFLLSIIRYGAYFSLLTPFIYSYSFYYPFSVPKAVFFRIIVDIILMAYIFLLTSNSSFRPRLNVLTISIAVFLGIVILTSITGINFEKSFWGNFERIGGILTYIHLFAFFIILSSVFKERRDWEKLFTVSILIGILIIIYTLISSSFSIESGATLGNSSFLGAYLLFDIFFAIILLLTKVGNSRIFYSVSLVILVPALFLSECKGAIIGFCVGLFLMILGYFIFLKRPSLKWFVLGAFLLLAVSGIIIFASQSELIKYKTELILNAPTIQARFVVWQIAWQGWKDKFLLGWGPENFDIAFNKNFDPRLSLPEYGAEVSFDKAHNIILDVGVTSGLLGVLGYLTILATAFYTSFKSFLKPFDKNNIIAFGGMAILLAVYFLQNFLVLDVISTYLMFFLVLAFLSNNWQKNYSKNEGKAEKKKPLPQFLAAVLVLLTVPLIYFGSIQPARASFYIHKFMALPIEEAIPIFQKSLKTSSIAQLEANKNFSYKLNQSYADLSQNKNTIEKSFIVAIEESKKNVQKNPNDFYPILQLGVLYNDFYRFEQNYGLLQLAENSLKRSIELSPKNQRGYWNLADTEFFLGNYAEQTELLQKAINLEPKLVESHWYLATAYKMNGQEDLAWEKFEEIKNGDFNYRGKYNVLNGTRVFYFDYGDYYPEIFISKEFIWASVKYNEYKVMQEKIESRDPKNSDDWMLLSLIYNCLKDKEKEKEAIEKTRELNPKMADVLKTFLDVSGQ